MKLETGYHLPKFGWTGKNNVWKLPVLIIWKRFLYLLISHHHIYIYPCDFWASMQWSKLAQYVILNGFVCVCGETTTFNFTLGLLSQTLAWTVQQQLRRQVYYERGGQKSPAWEGFCQKQRLNNWSDFDHCTACHFSWQQTYPSSYTLKTVCILHLKDSNNPTTLVTEGLVP